MNAVPSRGAAKQTDAGPRLGATHWSGAATRRNALEQSRGSAQLTDAGPWLGATH